ncbi:hypothetical protein IH981_03770 [Patescibacteria group bacterium]|nr:hypothetical protein [Patescibacteria group bacterium]
MEENKEKKKIVAYTLVIDEGRSRILLVMLGAFTKLLPLIMKAHPELFNSKDKAEIIASFVTEISDKIHEAGWCASNCKHNK